MDIEAIYNELAKSLPAESIQRDVAMSSQTSFKIGGPADLFVTPNDKVQLQKAIQACRKMEVPYYIMGNGSNLLVSDKGFRGVIIQIYKQMNHIEIDNTVVRTGAGILLSTLAKRVLDAGLTGLEFASGIPGTVGGAVYMNAGAYGGEIKDVLVEATIVDHEGNIRVMPAEALQLGYRTSALQNTGDTIVEAVFKLTEGDRSMILEQMRNLDERRRTKQPLEFPSAGSTFKRPTGYYAGKLIMDAGLAGYSVGDATVSTKHCGFVVNNGNASCQDVLDLIEHITTTVKERFGVDMEPEVRIIGEF